MALDGKRDRSRQRSGVQPSVRPPAARPDPRIHEAMQVVAAAYHALSSEDPPQRGRARQLLRHAIATLSAVAEPHTTEANRIATFLREADPHANLIVVRGQLLSANAALLALCRASPTPAASAEGS